MKRIPIVIHGLMGVFPFISYGTKGIDKLIDALPATQDSRDFLQSDWKSAWKYIQDCKRKYGAIEVILIGHSMGCYRNIEIAKKCRVNGILVRYMAAIDPTAIGGVLGALLRVTEPMAVPENVAAVDEFWATSGAPAMARLASPSGKKGGRYIYPDDWTGDRPMVIPSMHIPLASHEKVVKRIVSKVGGLLK